MTSLSDTEKQFIRENFGKIPVRDMTKRLKRGGKTIYDFVKEEGISKCTGEKNTTHHPWRKANRQLENYAMNRMRKVQAT